MCFGCDHRGRRVFLLTQLSGSFESGCCRLAEEPHESLDVLGHRCQEELLTHKLQSPQSHATQTDLILEFREQSFHLLLRRFALANSGVFAKSGARCRAGSSMWMARERNTPLVHCAFSEHAPQRLRVPM
jgi:hypothetical protein